VTGLEPVRHEHTPLKRACLPVPAHSLTEIYYTIILNLCQEFFKLIFFEIFKNIFIIWKKSVIIYYNDKCAENLIWRLNLWQKIKN